MEESRAVRRWWDERGEGEEWKAEYGVVVVVRVAVPLCRLRLNSTSPETSMMLFHETRRGEIL